MTQELDANRGGYDGSWPDEARVDVRTDEPATPVVNSFTEWECLEEVIVGRADHACVPQWHLTLEATLPRRYWPFFKTHGGQPFAPELLTAAAAELDELSRVLEAEGVVVRRPDAVDWSRPIETPAFRAASGLYGAMPRDCLLVIGNEIIEAPMAWRCRYLETRAFRALIRNYFRQGARWTAAPKPELEDSLYRSELAGSEFDVNRDRSAVTEDEPVFDAADFCRIGRDIFCQLSHVTNRFGVAWLRRHLGEEFRIHVLQFNDPNAMHIDATFVPLAPSRLLVNPKRVTRGGLPQMFRNWELLWAPPPTVPDTHPLYFTSPWLSANVLSIDEKRVIVEMDEKPMIEFLTSHGFEPIPVRFRHVGSLGGGFHCATIDIRRRGRLRSYFE